MPALIVLATAWGLAVGLALPRAVHRLAVEPGLPWRAVEQAGWRGWIGLRSRAGAGSSALPDVGSDTPAGPVGGGPAGARGGALLGALICAALAVRVGARPELAVWLLLVPPGLLLARVDLAVRRLPDVLTLPAAAGTAALLAVAALLPGHAGSGWRALLGGPVLGACYFLLFLVNPAGMGRGDAKLALTVGMVLGWYGWAFLFAGTLLAFVLGASAALVLLAMRRADRRTALPFGPFMLIGALGAVLQWAPVASNS